MPKKSEPKPPAIKKKTVSKKPVKRGPSGRRVTIEQKREILSLIIHLLSEMEHPSDILEIIKKKYGLQRAQVDNYIREAREKMRESVEQEFNSALANAISRLKTLKRKVSSEGDRRTELGVERELNRLLLPAKLEISGSGGGPIVTRDETPMVEITPDALFEAVRILRKAEGKDVENDQD